MRSRRIVAAAVAVLAAASARPVQDEVRSSLTVGPADSTAMWEFWFPRGDDCSRR